MNAYRQLQLEPKVKRLQSPSPSHVVPRKYACGGTCERCSDQAGESITRVSDRGGVLGHSLGSIDVFAESERSSPVQDQTQSGGLGEDLIKDVPPASTMEPTTELDPGTGTSSGAPVIDSVEMVTSSSGAVGGFDAITCDASLNQPGPYNDHWAKGAVANVQQVHFHLSQGWPGDVRANRQVNRSATMASKPGKPDVKTGWDGPPAHEYLITKDKLVIADAPGFCARGTEGDFPVTYSADFSLYAFDPLNMNILASISYHVEISKTSFGQIDPVNTITVTDKKIGSGVKSPVPPKKAA